MTDQWRFAKLAAEHLASEALSAFAFAEPQRSLMLMWNDTGGAARVVYSGAEIAGLLAIAPDEFALFAYVVPSFRRQHLAEDGLTNMMLRIVAQRGTTTFVATTEIAAAGEHLAHKLGLSEVARTDKEIRFARTIEGST